LLAARPSIVRESSVITGCDSMANNARAYSSMRSSART
jgi:hypothetical protein